METPRRSKYKLYTVPYNEMTRPAPNISERWSLSEDRFLWEQWTKFRNNPEKRVWVAKRLGRTYVACMRRYTFLRKTVP